MYFTGSMELNVAMREVAIENGFKLSDAGLYKTTGGTSTKLADSLGALAKLNNAKCKEWVDESKIFKAFGIKYLEPSEREADKIVGIFG